MPWVWALNALQNSMMFRPRWPSAGPIGGDGFALPAGTCSLMKPTIFFAMTGSSVASSSALADASAAAAPRALPPGLQTAGDAGSAPVSRRENQTFSTCAKSSSTGVARPKIVTDTRTLDLS